MAVDIGPSIGMYIRKLVWCNANDVAVLFMCGMESSVQVSSDGVVAIPEASSSG